MVLNQQAGQRAQFSLVGNELYGGPFRGLLVVGEERVVVVW